jgi:parallel beta helix pectate lyase-like protein
MRVQSRSHTTVSVLSIISILLILLAAVGSPSADTARNPSSPFPAVTCPSPTVENNGQCRLTKDEPLQKTLRLVSNTTLDCRGHTLTPTTLVPPGSVVTVRSTPEVAIFLNGVENVKILNCKITGFDFGIFAINSKVLPDIRKDLGELVRRRNIIARNNINARFAAISLAAVDNTEIRSNIITYTTAGGRGLYVGRDSDLNRILSNTITGDIASATSQAVGAPGPVNLAESPNPNPNMASNPISPPGQAVLITQTLGPEPTLLNAIIEGELFQLTVANSSCPDAQFSEDNIFSGNTITFTQNRFDAVVLSIAQRTIVRDNTISNTLNAIRTGLQSGPPPSGLLKRFHGGCTSPPGRFCYDDGDCNILGTTGSSCSSPSPPTLSVFWVSDGNVIDKNRISGLFNFGIATTGSNTLIERNTITGTGPLGANTGIVLVAKSALETSIVTRNIVTNVSVALALNNKPAPIPNLPASAFGARITLNNFTNYNKSVQTDIAARLSADGRGNFWGLPCRPLGGFDPASVDRIGGLPPGAVVTDDHAYRIPVAQIAGGSLPQPCR